MKNPTIEISYEGQTKGSLRIGDEEIPVYLTEIVSKPLQSEIDWSLPCNFLCYPKVIKYERTFTFREIV